MEEGDVTPDYSQFKHGVSSPGVKTPQRATEQTPSQAMAAMLHCDASLAGTDVDSVESHSGGNVRFNLVQNTRLPLEPRMRVL